MKILVITHEYPPVGGGGGHVARDLSEGLSALGHEIKVITAGLMGGVIEERNPSASPFSLIRVPTIRRDLARASMPAMISFIISSVVKGFFLIRKWKPDLIHVHFAVPSGPIAWLLSKLTGVPYLITIHLGDIPGGTPAKTDRWFRLIKPLTVPIWKEAKQIVAVSSFSRELALAHYDVPIEVIHNGVDLGQYQKGEISINHPPRIVFAGRFVPQKNPLTVIRTLAEIADLEWELVMMGDGELFEQVTEEVRVNGLEDRIRLPGWVSPEQVKKQFLSSDILFMPSLSEGLPVVGVHALASGLAFVVSDIGGFLDLVEQGENGFRIPLEGEGTHNGFVSSLRDLLISKQNLLAKRKSSLYLSKRFDMTIISQRYEKVLNAIFENENYG